MPSIRSFRAIRPCAEHVTDVIINRGVAGDREAAVATAAINPYSFLQVSHTDMILAAEGETDDLKVRSKTRETFRRFLENGILAEDPVPCIYIYRLTVDDHPQTGLIACVDVEDFLAGHVKRHELTRDEKVVIQYEQFDRIGGSSEPILLTYDAAKDADSSIKTALAAWTAAHEPVYDFEDAAGIRQQLWPVADESVITILVDAFAKLDSLYICDGHHRITAVSRYYEDHRTGPDAEKSRWFTAAIYPSDEMRILDYNRAVRDLAGLSEEEFLKALTQAEFTVTKLGTEPVRPARHGEYTMVMDGIWYRLNFIGKRPTDSPVAELDVSVLQERVLKDILGIENPQNDPRLAFLNGTKGIEALQTATQQGMKVAFAIMPIAMPEIIKVADAGLTMPPKSTCFDPKPVAGLVIYLVREI